MNDNENRHDATHIHNDIENQSPDMQAGGSISPVIPLNQEVYIRLFDSNYMWHINHTGKIQGECVHLDTYDGTNKEMVITARKNAYAIQFRRSGMYIDVEGKSTERGKVLHQWHKDVQSGSNNQIFAFDPVPDEPGLYYIKTYGNEPAKSRYVGCDGISKHAKLKQLDTTPDPKFKWVLQPRIDFAGEWQTDLIKKLGGKIDSMTIADVSLPGTHDSGASHGIALPLTSQCQSSFIGEQLEMGVRYLDIRCDTRESPIRLSHGIYICKGPSGEQVTLDKVFETAMSFLAAHPEEYIVMQIKREEGKHKPLEEAIRKKLDHYGKKFYMGNEIPTLKNAKGKLILLRRFELAGQNDPDKGLTYETAGIDVELWPDKAHDKDKAAEEVPLTPNKTRAMPVYVQDKYNTTADGKIAYVDATFMQVAKAAKENSKRMTLNFSSCIYNDPRSAAANMNAKLSNQLSANAYSGPCVLLMDYAHPALVRLVFEKLNRHIQ